MMVSVKMANSNPENFFNIVWLFYDWIYSDSIPLTIISKNSFNIEIIKSLHFV